MLYQHGGKKDVFFQVIAIQSCNRKYGRECSRIWAGPIIFNTPLKMYLIWIIHNLLYVKSVLLTLLTEVESLQTKLFCFYLFDKHK
jgi:hypothetical protein